MNRLHAVRRYEGSTPSAMALAAVRESIFKRLGTRKRDKIVIHLTDGMPNFGENVPEQVRLNREAGIDTYCILVYDEATFNAYRRRGLINYQMNDDEMIKSFKDSYGDKFQYLNSYDKLLKCLTDLFSKITEVR
jgi:hypothetical protein